MKKFTVHNNAAADAGADKNTDEIRHASARAECVFTERSDVHVVVNERGNADAAFKFRFERDICPTEIWREDNHACRRLKGSGRANPDCLNRLPLYAGFVNRLLNTLGDSVNHGSRALVRLCGDFGGAQNLAFRIHNGSENFRAAHIYTDNVIVHHNCVLILIDSLQTILPISSQTPHNPPCESREFGR